MSGDGLENGWRCGRAGAAGAMAAAGVAGAPQCSPESSATPESETFVPSAHVLFVLNVITFPARAGSFCVSAAVRYGRAAAWFVPLVVNALSWAAMLKVVASRVALPPVTEVTVPASF